MESFVFEKTRAFLQKIELPPGDLSELPSSKKRFSDSSHFRIEIPTVNSVEAVVSLLSESKKLGITVNRVTETFGMFRYTKNEILSCVKICEDYGCELVMSTGPRAVYDTGGSVSTEHGSRIGYRLRGQEQLVRALEDIKRGIEFGVKQFLIYDEGMLWVLDQMRKHKEIPSEIKFKISAHCGHCNPASFKLLENIGADSVNPVRDLQLSMIAALRQAVNIPIDCHTDNPASSGGFIRTYEAPEIVRIAAPVYLKTGNSVISSHGQVTTQYDGRLMAKQAAIVIEMIERYFPEALQSKNNVVV